MVGVPAGEQALLHSVPGHGAGCERGLAAPRGRVVREAGRGRAEGPGALQAGPGSGRGFPHRVLGGLGQQDGRTLLVAGRPALGALQQLVLRSDHATEGEGPVTPVGPWLGVARAPFLVLPLTLVASGATAAAYRSEEH